MPDERLITEIESILNQVVELGAATERTRMVPNLLVRNSNPGLTGFILVRDDRDGDNILARTVPGVIYNTNDLVNVLFIAGGEAIAFQQGSASASGNIWGIVSGTSTDIFYNSGDVGIGKTVAPDARLELLDTAQPQLRLTFQEDTKFVDFTLDTNHDLTIDPSSTGLIKLNATVTIPGELQHEGDTDTKIGFTDDDIEFTVGNLSMLKLTETAQDVIRLGPGSGDVDINFNGDAFLQGNNGHLIIGATTAPSARLVVFDSGANVPTIFLNDGDITVPFSLGTPSNNSTTVGRMGGASGADGGLVVSGLTDSTAGANSIALWFEGYLGAGSPIAPAITINGYKTDGGTSSVALANSELVLQITNAFSTKLITVLGNGDMGINGVTSPSTELDIGGGSIEFEEMTAPAGGAANTTRLYAEDDSGTTRQQIKFNSGNAVTIAKDGGLATYTPTNVTTDRSYDANATTLDEIADVLGTLIADFQAAGILG